MHFIRNLEDDKLEMHFTKEEYQAMSHDKKAFVKSNFRFAPSVPCWRSMRKLDNIGKYLLQMLSSYGFEDHGTAGEKLSFAEKVEREQEKAAARADYMAEKEAKNEKESTDRYNAAKEISSYIPFGQPILVGHHSEGRHRRDLQRIDDNMRKSVEASDKAAYYADRLANAEYTAEGKKFKNAGYLVNRIKECDANIRTYERRLQGKMYSYSEPREISETERQRWTEKIAEEQDKRDYMEYCLKQLAENGKTVWSKDLLKGMKYVKVKGRWHELVRANPTTVSTANDIVFPDPVLARKYALKYNYGEVQDAAKDDAELQQKKQPTQ